MDKFISNASEEQQDENLEIDYYSWLTDEEEELFSRSGFKKVKDWVEASYGVSVDFWIDTKRTLKILEQYNPKINQKPTPLPTYKEIKLAREKARNAKA